MRRLGVVDAVAGLGRGPEGPLHVAGEAATVLDGAAPDEDGSDVAGTGADTIVVVASMNGCTSMSVARRRTLSASLPGVTDPIRALIRIAPAPRIVANSSLSRGCRWASSTGRSLSNTRR